jgi:hypothetical protein
MTAPDLTYTLVLPLEEKYNALQRAGNKSVVFSLLLNRVHFIRDQNITTSSLSRSRAALCEILATRTLRDYGNSMLDLTRALTTRWSVYNGADERVMALVKDDRDEPEDRVGNALEMAILGRAKRFIRSSSCQKVINGIWTYVHFLSDPQLRSPCGTEGTASIRQKAITPFSQMCDCPHPLTHRTTYHCFCRHTNGLRFISTILIKPHYLTTIGMPALLPLCAAS